jgi:hypothetical protein
MGVEHDAVRWRCLRSPFDLSSKNSWWKGAAWAGFFSPLRGFHMFPRPPGLRPFDFAQGKLWAAIFRRFAAGRIWSSIRLIFGVGFSRALGLGFGTPVLGLAIQDCVTLAGRIFQLPAIDNGYEASGVFDQARLLKNTRCHRHACPPRS